MCLCVQVVKLWNVAGEQRGVVRTQTSLLTSQRVGPVTTLAFHPYHLALAAGSLDPIVAFYPIDFHLPALEKQSSQSLGPL